ncbi:winged helix-turn-helix transcriptional regulator [Streptomyces sp. NPDC094038]|uniref:winged helix-turn-helix transcriptional regulator n=1 Tax=Streptomyces sp. NPDC094038 TaxID=3366055 RepID=UPI00380CE1A3
MARSYEQACLVARALDVLGERWTLLIVRELALGPRRYGDLLEALPGIGTSLLAARLKHLERHGVLRRVALPGPGRAAVYELSGQDEMPILAALAEWGARLGPTPVGHRVRAAWGVVAMRLTALEQAADYDTLTELVVDEELLWLQGDGEQVRVELGRAPVKPALRLTCDTRTFFALARGNVDVDEALASGDLAVVGDPDAARLFFRLFRMPGAHPVDTVK